MDPRDVTTGIVRRPDRPPVRRLVAAVAGVPAAALLVMLGLAVAPVAPRRVALAGVAAAGLALCAVAAAITQRTFARRVGELERQRDAFYRGFTRWSKSASLGDISFSIAHDLNNPLAIVNEEAGWCEDLLRASPHGDERAQGEFASSLAEIRRQVRRASDLTRRVLTWGRDVEHASSVDIAVLLAKTKHLLESSLAAGGVSVVERFADQVPPVTGEIEDFRQVFFHLVKNAVEAMPDGGTLTLATFGNRDHVRVSISDTGSGIPADRVARIFEPFYTTKPEGKGTGLGLPIAAWIVQRAGGRIEVDSRVGHGTTFHVTLPAATGRGSGASGERRTP
jgi:two-component system NtrC family sensor kinase